ncbi:MAG: B12-binding domain-containing radical SAM protein [Campylobacteraceae bacterium 4484_4]|nr:MAG: B12-binding domain-containing radical SAM protein [Campylobacteraceae bacterium 4484_4]
MHEIVLVGINSRYSHSAFGLRYLRANLKELRERSVIEEFVIGENPQNIAEKILRHTPKIVGIGTYIWNAPDVHNLIETLKKVSPQTTIVLGGPEVSHPPFRVDFSAADYIVPGEGEIGFYTLCRDLLAGTPPKSRIPAPTVPKLKALALPYDEYSDHDIAHRHIYVEASRGCPFECEFCLSAIDERVRMFDMERLMESFEKLWQRGARKFKFIDRTFNLNIRHAIRLIDFFLAKEEPCELHFEVIPDHFPEALRERIKAFPPASLQLEIGIQTLNPEILANIHRRMDLQKVRENIAFLEQETNAHLHLDLIVGLPGESLESFANNLNTLKKMTDAEIQIGILKKLSGTTLHRHDEVYGMVYSDIPPYDILKNDLLSFETIQKMKRFARYWDIVYNSGNFRKTVTYIFDGEDVFGGFFDFSTWIFEETESTWQISLLRMTELIFRYLTRKRGYDPTQIADTILEDILRVGGRKIPGFLRDYASHIPDLRKNRLDKSKKRQELRTL